MRSGHKECFCPVCEKKTFFYLYAAGWACMNLELSHPWREGKEIKPIPVIVIEVATIAHRDNVVELLPRRKKAG